MTILASVESPGWIWFEEVLAYDNARLPNAGKVDDQPDLLRRH